MKKYLKRLAATYKYVFKSPWNIIGYHNTYANDYFSDENVEEIISPDDGETHIVEKAGKKILNIWENDKETVSQILYEQLSIPTEISLDIDGKYILTTVLTKQKLSKEQLDQMTDWLSGQFSDGFGEGMESTPALEETIDEDLDGHSELYISDLIDFEKWCDIEGFDIPDDENSEEYEELHHDYDDAKTDVETHSEYYVNVWPNDFKLTLISTKVE